MKNYSCCECFKPITGRVRFIKDDAGRQITIHPTCENAFKDARTVESKGLNMYVPKWKGIG